LPYQPLANITLPRGAASGPARISLSNAGEAALQISVRAAHVPGSAPQFRDVGPCGSDLAAVPLVAGGYDIWAHGPNGFLRHFAGDASSNSTGVEATVTIAGSPAWPRLLVTIVNQGHSPQTVTVGGEHVQVRPGTEHPLTFDPLEDDHGWYDLAVSLPEHTGFVRRFAGHLENGRPSMTG
jgi:phospholipase C